MAYTLVDVLNALMAGIQDTLYFIAKAVADNAQVIATIVIVGVLAYAVMRFGSRIFRSVTGWLSGLF